MYNTQRAKRDLHWVFIIQLMTYVRKRETRHIARITWKGHASKATAGGLPPPPHHSPSLATRCSVSDAGTPVLLGVYRHSYVGVALCSAYQKEGLVFGSVVGIGLCRIICWRGL